MVTGGCRDRVRRRLVGLRGRRRCHLRCGPWRSAPERRHGRRWPSDWNDGRHACTGRHGRIAGQWCRRNGRPIERHRRVRHRRRVRRRRGFGRAGCFGGRAGRRCRRRPRCERRSSAERGLRGLHVHAVRGLRERRARRDGLEDDAVQGYGDTRLVARGPWQQVLGSRPRQCRRRHDGGPHRVQDLSVH